MSFCETPVCTNCRHPYVLKEEGRGGRRLPLLLACGHTYCNCCLQQFGRVQQHARTIACPECRAPTIFSPEKEIEQQLMPNLGLLAIAAARLLQLKRMPDYSSVGQFLVRPHAGSTPWVPEPLPPEQPHEVCEHCEERRADVKCRQCVGLYCSNCFTIVHAASKPLKKHVSIPATQALSSEEYCPAHPGEPLRLYCEEEAQLVCSLCSLCGHQGHHVTTLNTAADRLREQLRPLLTSARERLKRFTEMEKALSQQLPMLWERSWERVEQLRAEFLELHAALQQRELALTEELARAIDSQAGPTLQARSALQSNLTHLASTIAQGQNTLRDNLELVKNARKLMEQLSEGEQMPQHFHMNIRDPIRVILDGAIKKQLLEVGSISSSQQRDSAEECNCDSSLPTTLPRPMKFRPSPSPHPLSRPPSTLSDHREHSPHSQRPGSASPRRERQVKGHRGGSFSPSTVKQRGQVKGHRGSSLSPSTVKQRGRVKGHRGGSLSPRGRVSPVVALEETEEVLVTHVETPSEFFVQFSHNCSRLETLMRQLNRHCRTPHPISRRDISPGLVCAAQFSEDQLWYRAVVEQAEVVSSPPYATVVYSDYGNTETVSLDRLSSLPPSLSSSPPLCSRCSLVSLHPPSRHQHLAPPSWATHAITQFNSLLKANAGSIRMKVYEREVSGLLQVDLFLPPLLSLRERLVAIGIARLGPAPQAPRLPLPPSLPLGDTMDVIVATVNGPHDFHVQTLSSAETLEWLRTQLDSETSEQRQAPSCDPRPGAICCSQYTDDGRWYRARVIGVEGESVVVDYVDYGNKEKVASSAITPLPHQLIDIPPQAIHCCLAGVQTHSGVWTEEECDQFCDILDDGSLFSMTVRGRGSPLPVEMKNKSTAQNVANILMEQGLARSDPSGCRNWLPTVGVRRNNRPASAASSTPQQRPSPIPKTKLQTPPLVLVTDREGKLSDTPSGPQHKPQVQPVPLLQHKPQAQESPVIPPPKAQESPVIPPPKAQESPVIPPPKLPVIGETLTCQVVQVSSPSEFHISSDSEAGLRQAQSGPQEAHMGAWREGQCCLAHFHGDDQWHRAVVQEELGGEMYRVIYVDFGNIDSVPALAMAVLPALLAELPALAVRCRLGGARPPRGGWSHEACLWFSKLVLEKPVTITVLSLPADDRGPLEVQLAVGGEKVAALLQANGYADHTRTVSREEEGVGGYLPPVPPDKEEFVVSVTYVDQDGVIYGHILREEIPLIALMQELQGLCPHHPALTSLDHLSPGQPCCVQFSEDNCWYRASVLEIDKETAKVCYVDFGNTEVVGCSAVVPLSKLGLPVQAFAMKLAGLEGECLGEEQLVLLADLLVDSHLKGRLEDGCSDDGYPLVSLWLPGGRGVAGEVRREGPNSLSQCTSSDSELGLD